MCVQSPPGARWWRLSTCTSPPAGPTSGPAPAVVGDASAFLRTARAGVKIVAGDLNKAKAPPRRRVALQGLGLERPAGRVLGPVTAGRPNERCLGPGAPLGGRAGLGPGRPGDPVRGSC